jgi:hypothetical protein
MPKHDFSAQDSWGTNLCSFCGKYQKDDEYKPTKCSLYCIPTGPKSWKKKEKADCSVDEGYSSSTGLYAGGHYGK